MCLTFTKNLRSFKVAIKISLWSHFPRNMYCNNHFYFSRRFVRNLCTFNLRNDHFLRENDNLSKEVLKERRRCEWNFCDIDEQILHVIDIFMTKITRYNDKLSGTWLVCFRSPISHWKTSTNFYFHAKIATKQSNGLANGRDSRRKGRTLNSAVMKFIAATWSEATTRKNTVPQIISEIIHLRIFFTKFLIYDFIIRVRPLSPEETMNNIYSLKSTLFKHFAFVGTYKLNN